MAAILSRPQCVNRTVLVRGTWDIQANSNTFPFAFLRWWYWLTFNQRHCRRKKTVLTAYQRIFVPNLLYEAPTPQYGPVTMIVPASGHQVRCIPWVQMGTFNKKIGFLCGLKLFASNIFCGEYLQSSQHLMLQMWLKPLLWKMCQ